MTFQEDEKKFDELLELIVNNRINDKNITEFETNFKTTLTDNNSENYFHVSDAFENLLTKIAFNEKYKKIYKHLDSNKQDINLILFGNLKFEHKLKILKYLLLFINYDCDNNQINNECNEYKKFDEYLLSASQLLKNNGKQNNYKSYYSIYNNTKRIFGLAGKRKNRKTKHAKRKNQKAKSKKNGNRIHLKKPPQIFWNK
jgi:hypothetical protein